ncbi:MAG: RagB/SusD family nutrient uptake outer membrane protein [Prevotella sp.]|nr:RagB/SusD family nutrient uptake outer membrane protein [Prevotella sp.]
MNLLSSVDQLELLLNNQYSFGSTDMKVMCGDMINSFSNLVEQINRPQKSRNVIMWTWDEASLDQMAELTNSDGDYQNFYNAIGTIANPVLEKIDQTEGSESKKKQVKCEALTLRAFSHLMLVNKFAAAYNPSTASNTRGIIVMTEDVDITIPQQQKTVEEVYNQILDDVNEAIQIDGLPSVSVNRMRFNKAGPYAVKALALMCMQRWEEAEAAAKQALSISSEMANLNTEYHDLYYGLFDIICKKPGTFIEDYFYTNEDEVLMFYPYSIWNQIETGHAHKDYIMTDAMMAAIGGYMMGEMYLGDPNYVCTEDFDSGWNEGGLRVPQMHLIVAECELHKNNITEAMNELDKIRVNRINPRLYQPLKGNVSNMSDAIAKYKQTALGENLFSNFSFVDKKRWNEISGWEATYTRTIGDTTYELKPGSKMWIFPFPLNSISVNPNLEQNYK